jgi:hypothetical protein
MGAQGTASLNFGAFPGTYDASVAVTGQTAILSGSLAEAWIFPAATADHSVDEHLVEALRVVAGNVIAGTGFTIYGFHTGTLVSQEGSLPRLYGIFNIGWVWN